MGIEEKIKIDVDLANLTTWRIGGLARFFIEIKTQEDLSSAILWAKTNNYKFIVLGGGSNVLVSDLGFDGLVIKIVNDEVIVKGDRMEIGAGAPLIRAVHNATANALAGLDWAIGIPGSMGGAIRGNAGAYGSEIGQYVETIEVYSIKNDKFYKLSQRDCDFGYRESLFKNNNDLLVWKIDLKLVSGDTDYIRSKTEEYLDKRLKSQPKLPSAGCVFKNLTIEKLHEYNEQLAHKAEEKGVVKGGKVAAGWIIDQLDLKGKSIGAAKISLEHANFIVNTSRATSVQVIALISYIKQQVRDGLGVQLEEEIQYFGF